MRRRVVTGSLLTVPLLILAMASPSDAAASGHRRPPHHPKPPKVAVRCLGHRATLVVTAASPHVVLGTQRRDVIVVLADGHVVDGRGGNDLICGSKGADDLRVGT